MRLRVRRVSGYVAARPRPRAPALAAIAPALVAGVLAGGCAELPVSTRDPYGSAPASSATPWRPPSPAAPRALPRSSRPPPVPVDVSPRAGLADLIDYAHRANPETRRAWEEARAAAAQVGRAEAAYYPTLFLMASGGTSRTADQGPAPLGTFTIEGPGVTPQVQLNWILLDFGRRKSGVERRQQQLLQANFSFNRKLQEVAFAVARSYFALDAGRARVTAARVT